jgi:hypothetical protein
MDMRDGLDDFASIGESSVASADMYCTYLDHRIFTAGSYYFGTWQNHTAQKAG